MAYDKVVDSSVLNAGLKQIADAIREKAGTSDNLAFPTAMAEAIAAIEAGGGGGGSGGAIVASGEITPATATSEVSVTHGLGVVPRFFMLRIYPTYSATTDSLMAFVFFSASENKYKYTYTERNGASWSSLVNDKYGDKFIGNINENTAVVRISTNVTSKTWCAKKHQWIAIA